MVTVFRFYYSLSFKLNTEKNEKKKVVLIIYTSLPGCWLYRFALCTKCTCDACGTCRFKWIFGQSERGLSMNHTTHACYCFSTAIVPVSKSERESSWSCVAFMFYSRCSKNWSLSTSSELWFLRSKKSLFQKRNKSVSHAKWFRMLAGVTITN